MEIKTERGQKSEGFFFFFKEKRKGGLGRCQKIIAGRHQRNINAITASMVWKEVVIVLSGRL